MRPGVPGERVSSPVGVHRVVELAGFGRAAHEAREAVRETCSDHLGGRLPDALLVVTELVANAVSHTDGVGNLVLHSDVSGTELTVCDRGGSPTWPRVADGDPLAESGRGLRLVEALADSWHTRAEPEGKAVTAVFRANAVE
ncbi:histidine kinase [Streptomyces chromofuscus]|nr:histidine kinase [Streptomyces chromofuscus]